MSLNEASHDDYAGPSGRPIITLDPEALLRRGHAHGVEHALHLVIQACEQDRQSPFVSNLRIMSVGWARLYEESITLIELAARACLYEWVELGRDRDAAVARWEVHPCEWIREFAECVRTDRYESLVK